MENLLNKDVRANPKKPSPKGYTTLQAQLYTLEDLAATTAPETEKNKTTWYGDTSKKKAIKNIGKKPIQKK